jgi:hypothetical protein
MLTVSLAVAVVTLGIGLVIIWPVSMIVGAVSASNQHADYMRSLAQPRPRVPYPPPAPSLNYDPRPGYRRLPPPPPPPPQP